MTTPEAASSTAAANAAAPVNVLLVGGGGREHALAAAISRSPRLAKLFITHPENPGLAALGTPVGVPVSGAEMYRLEQVCDRERIGLVVVGPEGPLAEGYADKLATPDRLVFGPRKDGALLESDKAWCKTLLREASVPTAEGREFTDSENALAYATSRAEPPVIKASGLAAGKGVFVPESIKEASDAIRLIMDERAFGDAGKKILGRKRHICVDTLGLILAVVVHAADIQDRNGGYEVLSAMARRFTRLKLIWADGGYAGWFVHETKRVFGRAIQIVKRSDAHKFVVLPKHWIVERTFGWFGRYRRLSKDYESLPASSEAMTHIAMINRMLHRLQKG